MSDADLKDPVVIKNDEQGSEITPAIESGPGAKLAAHRNEKGWTVEQVADQLNLAPRQIQAIEADNYAALPGIVIARGFVRAYAKLLKADPAPLVALMPGETVKMESLELKRALTASFSESRLPPMGRGNLSIKWIVFALLLIGGVTAVFVAKREGLFPILSGVAPKKVEKRVAIFTPSEMNGSSAVAEGGMATSESSNVPLSSDMSGDSGEASLQGSAATETAEKTVSDDPAIPSSLKPIVAPISPARQGNASMAKNNLLIMKMHEDSWVEVRGVDDSIVISRLVAAGSIETLVVTQPISVTIGNASGVKLTFRGAAIALDPSAKNNIVRLSLK